MVCGACVGLWFLWFCGWVGARERGGGEYVPTATRPGRTTEGPPPSTLQTPPAHPRQGGEGKRGRTGGWVGRPAWQARAGAVRVDENRTKATNALVWISFVQGQPQPSTHAPRSYLPEGTGTGAGARSGEGGLDEGSSRADAGKEGKDTHGVLGKF